MLQPDLTMRQSFAPFDLISLLTYSQSKDGQIFPVIIGENSDSVSFRIYNNANQNTGVADAHNVFLTTYDGATSASHTTSKSVVSQSWIHVYEDGYGEGVSQPGLFTQYYGEDTSIGGSNIYYVEKASDGSNASSIRAGSTHNDFGFIQIKSYASIPAIAGDYIWNFVLVAEYDWTP